MTTGTPKVKSEKTPTISSAVERYVLEYFITCSSLLQATKSQPFSCQKENTLFPEKLQIHRWRILIPENHPSG